MTSDNLIRRARKTALAMSLAALAGTGLLGVAAAQASGLLPHESTNSGNGVASQTTSTSSNGSSSSDQNTGRSAGVRTSSGNGPVAGSHAS